MSDQATENTDVEIWRSPDQEAPGASIHATKEGGIGINVGGHVIVQSAYDWHAMAAVDDAAKCQAVKAALQDAVDLMNQLLADRGIITEFQCPLQDGKFSLVARFTLDVL